MTIRQLLAEDAAVYQQLRLRGLNECPAAFSSSHAEESGLSPNLVGERITPSGTGCVWGQFDDTRLVGIVGIHRERQRQLSHKAVLWGMYVAPEARRRGVARALVQRALDHAARVLAVRSVNLGVNTKNDSAIALYRSLGFEIHGTERGYLLIDGVLHDEHFMGRQIDA